MNRAAKLLRCSPSEREREAAATQTPDLSRFPAYLPLSLFAHDSAEAYYLLYSIDYLVQIGS